MFKKISLFLASIAVAASAWSQIPISNLPSAQLPLQPTDLVIVDQNVNTPQKVTRKAPVSAFTALAPPLTSAYLLVSPDATIPNSRVLAGTANQVVLTDGGALGNLTLSLPQSICAACSPTFAGLTLTGALNGTSGVFSSTLQAASLSLTTPLQATSGGTGFGAYAIGDLLAASTTTALSKLSDVAAGSYLRSGGANTLPLWSTLTLPNAATTGDVLIATGTNAIGSLADVSAGSYLRSNGAAAAPVYSTVKIPNTAVTGDIWYGSAANTVSALAGNITTGVQFLAQTGSGAASAAPVWTTLPGSFTGFANPSGLIGLTAANGVATTATRSDATHALDQSIVPTWTGIHTFSATPVFNAGVTVNSAARNVASLTQTSQTYGNATDNPTYNYSGTGDFSRVANATTNLNLVQQNTNTGTTAVNQLALKNSVDTLFAGVTGTGATIAPWTSGPTTEASFLGSSGNIPLSIATNNTERMRINGDGSIAVRGPSGLGVLAYGTISNTGTGCTVSGDNYGIASCVRNSVGSVGINFSTATGSSHTCATTIIGQNSAPFTITLTTRNTTLSNYSTFGNANTLADLAFDIVCF